MDDESCLRPLSKLSFLAGVDLSTPAEKSGSVSVGAGVCAGDDEMIVNAVDAGAPVSDIVERCVPEMNEYEL